MNDHWEHLFKKAIAEYEHYMATVRSWESKKTIEESTHAPAIAKPELTRTAHPDWLQRSHCSNLESLVS